MIDTSELEIGNDKTTNGFVIQDASGYIVRTADTRLCAYAWLAGAAQEQARQLKAENERLKRRVEQIESTLDLATSLYTQASEGS